MEHVANWPFEKRLEESIRRALPKLGPEVQSQIRKILTPEALAVVAAVLVAWVASHAFGIGEIIDVIIVALGVFAIGLAIFEGLDHLYEFAASAYRARSIQNLDQAADHFAKAVTFLGIQAVLAVLFRGAPKSYRGGPARTPGPRTARGATYRPKLQWRKYVPGEGNLRAGSGWTTTAGDIVVSSRGSAKTRQLVLFHEKIHQLLTPKLYPLRNFRIRNRTKSYTQSSLSRYMEEALAEVVAQLRVKGVREFLTGIRFPVHRGYVFLLRRGDSEGLYGGAGVVTEIAGLLVGGLEIAGLRFDIYLKEHNETLEGDRMPEGE
jgi:hypothetical protein